MRTSAVMTLLLLLAGSLPATAAPSGPATHWYAAWSRPQSVVLGATNDDLSGGRGPGPLLDQSVRDVVRVTAAGPLVRLRLSDRYGAATTPDGTTALHVLHVTVARGDRGAAVVAATLHDATFSGARDVTVPPGGTVVSDPVRLPVTAGEDLAVSVHVEAAPVAPAHGASFATSWVSPARSGDRTRDVTGTWYTERTTSTLVLTGVDVRTDAVAGVGATTGGSVVDGFGTAVDRHTDWPSQLSTRLQQLPPARRLAVVNGGLGGTTAAALCAPSAVGPSVQERVGHDSLALPGVSALVVYAGTNDLGDGCPAAPIIDAFRSIARQARAAGVRVLIATITPRGSYTPLQNLQRAEVNRWLRAGGDCSGACDRSLDFDAVVRDPRAPDRIAPAMDSGDGVHPNAEGYRRIAASIPLGALEAEHR